MFLTMQVEEKRACPSCGAENGSDADFCWKCFARFLPVPPPPGAIPGRQMGWGRYPQQELPTVATGIATRQPAARRGSFITRIVVGVIAAAVAAVAVHAFLGSGVHLPDSVAGRPRMATTDIQKFEKDMKDLGSRNGLTVDAGGYGTGTAPEFLVLLVHGNSAESTDQLFDEFVGGITQSGAAVDRGHTVSGTRGSTEYRCLPVGGTGVTAAACLWREDGSVGIVLDLTEGVEGAQTTLWQVHDDAVG
jgi:hypothetical protein